MYICLFAYEDVFPKGYSAINLFSNLKMSEFDLRGWVEGGEGCHPFSKTSGIENSLDWIGGGEVLLGHILKFFLFFCYGSP